MTRNDNFFFFSPQKIDMKLKLFPKLSILYFIPRIFIYHIKRDGTCIKKKKFTRAWALVKYTKFKSPGKRVKSKFRSNNIFRACELQYVDFSYRFWRRGRDSCVAEI